jgi:hypothetical protein
VAFGSKEFQARGGNALYIALEDGARRVQARLRKQTCGQGFPPNMGFAWSWPGMTEGGLQMLGERIQFDELSLVVIDCLGAWLPPTHKNEDIFRRDYSLIRSIKQVADEHKIAILLIHHTRKAKADDALESVSGSYGLSAAADAIWVLKGARGQADAVLSISGRDLPEREIAIRFDPATCLWTALGDAAAVCISDERKALLGLLRQCPPMHPREIASALQKTSDAVRQMLCRAASQGEVRRLSSGQYTLSQVVEER